MSKIHRLCIIALALAASACASGPSIRHDSEPSANMANYGSFGFMDRLATDQAGYSSIMTAHLKRATRAQLERLGYVYDEHDPKLRVNFFLNIRERQELRSTPSAEPGFVGYRFGGRDLETVNYKAGTLRVDLVDAGRRALVWQGVAEGRLGKQADRDPAAAVDSVIAEIFRGFPPRAAGAL